MIRQQVLDQWIQLAKHPRSRKQDLLLCCKMNFDLSFKLLCYLRLPACKLGAVNRHCALNAHT